MLIILGKRKTVSQPSIVGGAIVLVEQLIKDLSKQGKEFQVVDLNYRNYKNKLNAFISIYKSIFRNRGNTFFLNCSNNGVFLFGIPVLICKLLFNSKVIVRLFGGNFNLYYEKQLYPFQVILKAVIKKSNLLLFEQKYQVDYFKRLNWNTQWFPNMRSSTNSSNLSSTRRNVEYPDKFVFIGHIRVEKGIDELLVAKKKLGSAFNLHLYGPMINYVPPEGYESLFKEIYKGPLKSDQVLSTLANYDVLVLPSHKEGYPGIIIEALSVGVPIIATELVGIVEMIGDSNCSIFVEPRNVDSLVSAIEHFKKLEYPKMSKNAFTAFQMFDADIQMPRITDLIDAV